MNGVQVPLDDGSRCTTKPKTITAFLFLPFGKPFHSHLLCVRQGSNLFISISSFNEIGTHDINSAIVPHSVFIAPSFSITLMSKDFVEKLRDYPRSHGRLCAETQELRLPLTVQVI